jgi:hypothetical protein
MTRPGHALAFAGLLALVLVGGTAEAAPKKWSARSAFVPTSGYGHASQSHTYASDAWMSRASQTFGGGGF